MKMPNAGSVRSNQMFNMVHSPSLNLVDIVIDEVALEGLEGITLEGLWKRLAQRLNSPKDQEYPKPMKEQIWKICVSIKDLTFYELPVPRQPLFIYDRYQYVDPDIGSINEPDDIPEDIYEHCPINDVKNEVRGSCATYNTRKLIDKHKVASLDLAEAYGQTLVIVASQSLRHDALIDESTCPTVEINLLQYCFLERVGRARYHGEVTQGKRSLTILKEDPRSLYYQRKDLIKYKLITKQMHYQKKFGHNMSGSLLHLPRFFVERKPKIMYLAEKIIEILKSRENNLVDYEEIKAGLQIESSIKNLLKTAIFQKIVKSDISVPYRMIYPNATPEEWQRKHDRSTERKIRALQLVDPDVDITDLWNQDEYMEDDEPYELNVTQHKLNVPVLKQANKIVEAASCEGLSQSELAKKMGVTKLAARSFLRNLTRENLISGIVDDIGRQRTTIFVSKRFEESSNISRQFRLEMDKMKEHTKISSQQNGSFAQESVDNPDLEDNQMEIEDIFIEIDETQPAFPRKDLFTGINSIFRRYKLTKHVSPYRETYMNVSEIADLTTRIERLQKRPAAHCLDLKDTQDPTQNNYRVIVNEMGPYANGGLNNLSTDSNTTDTRNMVPYRILKRSNLILAAVREQQVIENFMKVIKMINEQEDQEGYEVKIDKKSFLRILQKLVADRLIRVFQLTVIANKKEKLLTFICDAKVTINHEIIQSSIEQTKIKLCVAQPPPKRKLSRMPLNDGQPAPKRVRKSPRDASLIDPLLNPDGKFVKPKSNAKFIQMELLHKFMYYMVYAHPGKPKQTKAEQVAALRAKGIAVDEALSAEMSTIYGKDVGWSMFIPPLPTHVGWPKGWSMLCDILLRIPLSIYVKMFKFDLPQLTYYTEHPVRRHYLVKNLPPLIRNILLVGKFHITSVHEILTKLCNIGLVQFGPQKFKEKDQVFVYLNQCCELMDTTSSAPGYHKIEAKEYPVTFYRFKDSSIVDAFWFTMQQICMDTPLGKRMTVEGTQITVENARIKPELLATQKARTVTEAPKLDVGKIPGDRQGAAGIDSSLFAHLKKNWNWENFKTKNVRITRLGHAIRRSKAQIKPLKFTEFKGLKTITGPMTIEAEDLKQQKTNPMEAVDSMMIQHFLKNCRRQPSYAKVREVRPIKRRKRPRDHYDDVDLEALKLMNKRRVDWNPREDNILLVCKVVMSYLCPKKRGQAVTFTAVRDILHSYSRCSADKTSRACQRRIVWLMRQEQTQQSVALGVDEIRQNYYVNKRYGDAVARIRKSQDTTVHDQKIAAVFKSLVAYVAKKYYAIVDTESNECCDKPNTLQEFNLIYEIKHPRPTDMQFSDVQNVNDIHVATICAVLHSALYCDHDGHQWGYQRYRIYKQYPEPLLKRALNKYRSDEIITVKRSYVAVMRKNTYCMPMNSSQYQFSTSYVHKLQTKLPIDVYAQALEFVSAIVAGYRENSLGEAGGVKVLPATGGSVVALQDLLMLDKIDFNAEIPEQVITLEPKTGDHDEQYSLVEKRYQDIMTRIEQDPSAQDHVDDDPTEVMIIDETEPEGEKVPAKSNSDAQIKSQVVKKNCGRESDYSDDDDDDGEDDHNVSITFTSGTVVNLAKDDVERARKNTVDDSIHRAFMQPRGEEARDIFADSSIEQLKGIIDEIPKVNFPMKKTKVPRMKMQKLPSPTPMDVTTSCEKLPEEKIAKPSNFINDIIAIAESKSSRFSQKVSESYEMLNKSSRLAMLRMWDELSDSGILEDSQHAHTYFAVSAFGIYFSVPELDDERQRNPEFIVDSDVEKRLLPLDEAVYDQIVQDLNEYAVFPVVFPGYDNVKKYLVYKLADVDVKKIDQVHEFVQNKRERGVTLRELNDEFYKQLGNSLYDVLAAMVDRRLFLRSGVTEMHYVHHKYVSPWTVLSIKLTRLQRESLPLFPQRSHYLLSNSNAESSDGRGGFDGTRDSEMHGEDSEQTDDPTALYKNPPPNFCKSDDIVVIVRPWIKIDGVINREALHKLSSSILTHCILHPGILLTKVQARFVPVLQPYYTRELIEFLIKLKCLQWKVLQKSTVTFIDENLSTTLRDPIKDDGTSEYDSELVIEPLIGASLKFSSFFKRYLGKKKIP